MKPISEEINPKNLKARCWSHGMSVKDLADKIGRNRVTVHRAVKNPKNFGPTYELICKALN